jgi:hypothetical protein
MDPDGLIEEGEINMFEDYFKIKMENRVRAYFLFVSFSSPFEPGRHFT